MLQSLFFNNIFSFLEVRIMRYNKTFEVYKLCTFKKLFIYSLALMWNSEKNIIIYIYDEQT